MKEDKPGWQNDEPVERVYVNYDQNKNLRTHEANLPNQRDKAAKALKSAVFIINEANQNLTPSHKELLRWNFTLGHIGFQHIQWLIRTGLLKAQGNSKALANFETTKCSACDFGKGHLRPNKGNKIKNNPIKEQELKKDHLLPG